MPVHDWTRVDAGIFHDFHLGWIAEIGRALNRGFLPPDHYALAEQSASGFRAKAEVDIYATKARTIVVRHTSGHRVVAYLKVVSPGNKYSRNGLCSFVAKVGEMLRAGIHLLIV